ncbi:lysergyl peptide synthetase subunit 1 [Trichoderma arundinaceum]|uniref:Lysergyl peptide synthetase subunit 1 n=1 Tax=Trichoderma arundinaceum TaxID=490622 RepID=A0A395NF55_TRIAR|nr:lysergyl peptide synthetase subunit 1 [Trichoderma arundinaceum]
MSKDGFLASIGTLANLLPCDIQFESKTPLADTLRRAESDFIKALSYQQVSLDDIHCIVESGNDPLFNTCMTFPYQETSATDQLHGILPLKLTEKEDLDPTEYDITIHVGTEWQCYLLYRNHFMSEEQASHLADALSTVFISLIKFPHEVVEKIELFSPLDHQKLLRWNRTAPVASYFCLHDLIDKQCRSQPDDLAVFSWDGSLTYRELDRLSSSLANRLHEAGVRPEVFVPVCFDRCKWMPVAMLGIIKAGGAFCALDPSYPLSRLTEICQELKSTVILTIASNELQASQLAHTVVTVGDDLWSEKDDEEQQKRVPLSNIRPDNALYAVFTSGSTGKPKGVVVEHRSFSSCALESQRPLNIRPHDRILHFASYAFDLSIFEILTALTVGASIAIPSEKARREDLPQAVQELQATWAFLTPTVARMYQSEDFPSLKTLCLGGEAVQALDVEKWASKNLITGYNPAESCPLGISGPADQSAANFLGWSFSSQASWIVDPLNYRKLVPVGAVGELVIEGPAVARGYVHDPTCSLPESPFIVTPPKWLSRFRASISTDTRLYLTGDLVRYGRDGAVHFIGRKDLQVKVHGQRIELSEIEFHLERILKPFAYMVIVEAVSLKSRTILVAFIAPTENLTSEQESDTTRTLELNVTTQEVEALAADAVRQLRGILPNYMIPTVYQPVSHIPISRSGKIDRGQLRSLALSLPPETLYRIKGQSRPGNAPITDAESHLQKLFAQVLDIYPNQIGRDSDFFRLGGDSIQAMRLLALTRQEGSCDLTYQDIFSYSKLRDMASVFGSFSGISSSAVEVPGPAPFSLVQEADLLTKIASEQCGIPEEDVDDIYPCTALQSSLIAATAHEQDAYVSLQSFTLIDNIDIIRLQGAWDMTSTHHPILRTRIIQVNTGASYQVVVRVPLSWSERSSNAEFQPSFGLGTPLIQLSFINGQLLVAMHHALYDGWSLPLLIAEVDRAYLQLAPQTLPPFSHFVKHVVENEDTAASFWRAELQDADTIHFPTPPFLNYKPEPHTLLTKTIALTSSSNTRRNITIATEIQLAWAFTSYTYTSSQDVIFGVLSLGRGAPVMGVERMLGPTIASTPFRVLIDLAQNVEDALEDVQYRLVEQTKYEHLGLQKIAQLNRNAAAACSFQTMLIIESHESDEIRGTWFTRHEFLSELIGFSSHSLTLMCQLRDGAVEVTAIFDQSIVPDIQMERILSQFQNILIQIHASRASNISLGDISKLSAQDWDQLNAWNSTLPSALDLCVHEMVLELCQRQPEASAIHSWDGDMTYKELEIHARRLASHLQGLGVGPNTFIAIYLEKSLWMVVAQLGVLIAGAAFTALETSQPINHLREICRTVKPAVLLTSDNLRKSATGLEVSAPLVALNKQLFHQESGNHGQTFDNPLVKASNAMYSIATSGTTGKPKVVITEHRAFLANSKPLIDRWGLTPDSRVLQFAGYSFDSMVLEHFITLLAGGCLCVPSSFNRDNSLAMIINEMRVNWAVLTSSVIQLLSPATVPILKTIIQGGEPMHLGIINRWAAHVRLFNAYGPAECSVSSSSTGVISPDAKNPKNIGFATGGVCWIVDPENLESLPVPIGAEGELVIEGPILARGYLGDSARTAAAFAPLPQWLDNIRGRSGEGRVYRTGDIARYDPDGSISFVRRKDFQVKLRGQRLELLEVEYHVQNCFSDALQVVATIATLPDTQRTILVALVLSVSTTSDVSASSPPNEGMTTSSNNLLLLASSPQFLIDLHTADIALQERLPSYMVPSLFIPASQFPRDINGKVNRGEIAKYLAALSRKEWDSYISPNRVAPSTDLERKMQSLWATVLNIPPSSIGIYDSFFRLGGDSITCMQVVEQCRIAGIVITVKDIFKQRTIEKLVAMAVTESRESSITEATYKAESKFSFYDPGELEKYKARIQSQLEEDQVVDDIYPCSPIQQGILMSWARNAKHYEEVIQWKMVSRDSIDVDHLRNAWAQVVDRHPILRTIFLDLCEENYLDQVVLENYSPTVLVDTDGRVAEQLSTDYHQPMHHLHIKQLSAVEATISLHINHALVDGSSLFIIKRDLAMAYEGHLASSLPPPSYRNYIAYLQRCNSRKNSGDYWKSYLEGTAPCLFPDLKDPRTEDVSQTFETFTLELIATVELTQFCETYKLALTRMDEICFGYMTSGRHVPVTGVQDIVGPLFNMLVARISLPFGAPVMSIMQKYHDDFLARSASDELFNTLITIFNDKQDGKSTKNTPAVTFIGDDIHNQSEYVITLNILMLEDQSSMKISYHTSSLSSNYVMTVARAFRHVLITVLKQPQLHLNEIELLDEEDRSTLYEENRVIAASLDRCIHHTIHQRCLESPVSPAICSWDGDLSYTQLDQFSSSLAEQLISQGVGVEMTIPVLLEKSRWTPVAMLAVLKSGASFALMDASHPLGRLQTICEAIKPRLILASPQTRSKAISLSPHVIEITDQLFDQTHAKLRYFWPEVDVRANNAAYVVFTSGSTGIPKGAVVDHSCLATAIQNLQGRLYVNSYSRALQFSSHAWDIPVMDVLLTLYAGGCVCIPSDEERTGNIAQAANRMMVNWAILTPTVARLVMPEDFTYLETVILAGEAISSADLGRWHDKVRVIQGYGPAECSVISTVSEPLTFSSNPRNIGRPSGCVAWIVHRDNHNLLAPPGSVGELVLEGPIVGRGYINDSKRSAAAFIDPPSWLTRFRGGKPTNRLYKTGDLVYSSLDSSLYFVGRKDDQIKIRGQRVELGEVEAQVSKLFQGSHVVVEYMKDLNSGALAAFLLQKDDFNAPPGSSLLRRPSLHFQESVSAALSSLREAIPLYMIPTIFLPVAYLPRGPTGKTDRRLLRDSISSLSQVELQIYHTTNATRRAPSTPLEAQLQDHVSRVLHRPADSIPFDEDLFTIGLDSLTAMTLAASAREDGLTIPVPTIFQHPRLSQLATVLSQETKTGQQQCLPSPPNPLAPSVNEICIQQQLDRSQIINVVPTSYYQRGSIASHHTNFIALHFSQPLDPTAFRAAAVALVKKHAILRTAFVPFHDSFVQISLCDFDLPVKEFRIDGDDPSVVTESICREASKASISFGIPSTQLLLVQGRANGRLSAVLRLHRAQADGITVACLIADLCAILDKGATSSSHPTLEHADFIIHRAAHNSPSVFKSWRELLQGSSMTYLVPPNQYIRSTDRSHIEQLVTSTCDIPMPSPKGGITMATIVKAAWALCLVRQTQALDVVFAQLVRNRHLAIAGIERSVGPCLNYVPVRMSLQLDWTLEKLLLQVQRQHIQTMACDTADWDDLVVQSTSWPRDTEFGSAVHYLSAPVASNYMFPGNIPCQLQMYDFKMLHTYPMVTCIAFPSKDSATAILKIILTSAVFGQEVADRLHSLFQDMISQLINRTESLVMEVIDK